MATCVHKIKATKAINLGNISKNCSAILGTQTAGSEFIKLSHKSNKPGQYQQELQRNSWDADRWVCVHYIIKNTVLVISLHF